MLNKTTKKIFNAALGSWYGLVELLKKAGRLQFAKQCYPHVRFSWGCQIDDKCSFGRKVKVFSGSSVIDSTVGDYTYIGGDCSLMHCQIGKFCSIAPKVMIGLGKHPISESISTYPGFYKGYSSGYTQFSTGIPFVEYERIVIGNDVWIGAGAILLDGVTIGDGAIIGAGCVVTKDVAPFEIVGGCPAKHIAWRFNHDEITKLLEIKWWNREEDFLRKHSHSFFCKKTFFQIFG